MKTNKKVREILFKAIRQLDKKKIDTNHINSISKAASNINQTVRFDLEKKRLKLKIKKSKAKVKK